MNARSALLMLAAASALSAQVRLPQVEKRTLPNGATVILLRKPDVPLVSIRAVFRGGAEAEPANLNGIAAITSELMRRGTAARSSDQIALELDSLGATLQLASNRQMSTVAAEFMARTSAPALAIFEDVLLHPSFPEAEVKKVLAQSADQLRSVKDNPGMAIGRYFNGFYYPAGHPYRTSGAVTEDSLARMDRTAIEAFYKRAYTGRNLILIAAGDFDPATLGARISAIAAAVPAGSVFSPAKVDAPAHTAARLLLVDKPDATQTYFRIGMPGISRTSPDRVPLMIVNTLFGGRFTSMLNDELRVNSGLTYGAQCILEQDRLTGAIVINSYTRTDSTEKALDLTLATLDRLRTKGIDAAQLASAKAYIKGNFPTDRLETADQLADVLGELEFYGLNKGEIDDLFSRIDAVNLEQANAIARKYYTASALQFCLIGNAAKVAPVVRKYAPTQKTISIKAPGFFGE
ncbi:MAG: insulinase family protein [Acidobacteria bacterium]|nr:insulinase family protein [Acidobacteriota bacterium]